MSQDGALSGRRAFVTGGSKGIGAGIVRLLAAQGAEVIFTARDMAAAEVVCAQTGARAIELDVTDLPATHRAVGTNGPFDILVNNAGSPAPAYFTATTMAQWRSLLAVNLEAVFATTHAALPGMQAAGFGRIVNISSVAGRMGARGDAVYAAAKGGVIAFTTSIARENGRHGITANVIAPGPIDTPLMQRTAEQLGEEKLLAAMRTITMVGRLGTAEEVASAVAFLVSRDAGFITGETLGVCGGMV